MVATSHVWLALSIVALAAGPMTYELARRSYLARKTLDGFVLVAVAGLVALHVLPHSIREGGPLAILLMLLGLAGPYLIERHVGQAHGKGHFLLAVLVGVGLIPHAALDGLALAVLPSDQAKAALSLAVVLHRIPEGFAVWLLVRGARGKRWGAGCLCLMGLGTLCGYLFGRTYLGGLHGWEFALFQALLGGTLMHVLLHRPAAAPGLAGSLRGKLAECCGALLGVVLLLSGPHAMHAGADPGHGEGLVEAGEYGRSFLFLALETAPALLLGYGVAGALAVFLPQASLSWLGRGAPALQSLRGVAYGLPLPVCSCGVVPIYRSLILRGVPACAAMAFLVATPELGIESVLISWPLLGGELTVVRLVCAMVVAILAGWLVGQGIASQPPVDDDHRGPGKVPSLWGKIRAACRIGMAEVVDETAPWIVVGLAVAAFLHPAELGEWMSRIPEHLDVAMFAILGMPVYVCASGATPLAAVLIWHGVSPGAAIALLLTGPATNLTTFGILSRLHGRATALKFALTVMFTAIALGYAVKFLFPSPTPGTVLAHTMDQVGALNWTCLAILAVAFALSLVRLGPTAFVGSLFQVEREDSCCETAHTNHGSCGAQASFPSSLGQDFPAAEKSYP